MQVVGLRNSPLSVENRAVCYRKAVFRGNELLVQKYSIMDVNQTSTPLFSLFYSIVDSDKVLHSLMNFQTSSKVVATDITTSMFSGISVI